MQNNDYSNFQGWKWKEFAVYLNTVAASFLYKT